MLKHIPRVFASDYLYSDGPKAGSPSKMRPTALSPGGIRPGTGGKPGAEEFNWLLHSLTAHERATRYAWLFDWRAVGGDSPILVNGCADTHVNGFVYFGGSTFAPFNRYSPILNTITELSAPTSALNQVSAQCRVEDEIRMFGIDDEGNHGGWRVRPDASVVSISGGLGTVDAGGEFLAAYDAENDLTPLVNFNSTDGTVLGWHGGAGAGAGAATIAEATTQPSIATQFSAANARIATGGGVTLVLAAQGASSQIGVRTLDGGLTWSTVSHPFGGHADDRIRGLGFIPDYPGLGPIFVALHEVGSSGVMRLSYFPVDGGPAWPTLATLSSIPANTTYNARAYFIGHTMILLRANASGASGGLIYVHDMPEGKGFNIGASLSGTFIQRSAFDGNRLWVEWSTGDTYVSAPIGIPPLTDGSAFP